MATTVPGARPLAAWMDVLGKLEETLERSLDQAGEPDAAGNRSAVPISLQPLDDRLARLQAGLDRADRSVAEVEALLAAEADRLENWRRVFSAAQQRLADWAARSAAEGATHSGTARQG